MNIVLQLKKPYDLLERKIFFIAGPVFVLFFLLIFQPFGLAFFSFKARFLLSLLYSLPTALIWYGLIYIAQKIVHLKYTIGTTVLIIVIGNLLICMYVFSIWEISFNKGFFSLEHFIIIAFQVLATGLLTFVIFALIHYLSIIKRRIKVVNQINLSINQIKETHYPSKSITLESQNQQNYFTVNPNLILYITTADNYSEINWLDKGVLRKDLIRNTLSNVENNLSQQCNFFERCHNSYLVNILQVNKLSGNASAYKLIFNNIGVKIPLSRKYRNAVLLKIEQLKQVN